MAVKFRKDLARLLRDLKTCGYPVTRVVQVPGAHARTTDLILAGGLRVNWDAVTGRIWAEGPQPAREKLDRLLRRLYHPSWWVRAWTRRFQALVAPFRSRDDEMDAAPTEQEPRQAQGPAEQISSA